MTIQLQFVCGNAISSRTIAWFSAGHLSHVDAILPDGRLLGARSDHVGGKPPGVQVRHPGYAKWVSRIIMTIPTDQTKQDKFYDFLRMQIGKPYDRLAILGFLFNRDWRDDDSWICSELQAAALEYAGISPSPLYLAANKITPVACALVCSALGAIVN